MPTASTAKPKTAATAGTSGKDAPWDEVKRQRNRINSQRTRVRERLHIETLESDRGRLWLSNDALRFQNAHLREAIRAVIHLQAGRGGNDLAGAVVAGVNDAGVGLGFGGVGGSSIANALGVGGGLSSLGALPRNAAELRYLSSRLGGAAGAAGGGYSHAISAAAAAREADILALRHREALELEAAVRLRAMHPGLAACPSSVFPHHLAQQHQLHHRQYPLQAHSSVLSRHAPGGHPGAVGGLLHPSTGMGAAAVGGPEAAAPPLGLAEIRARQLVLQHGHPSSPAIAPAGPTSSLYHHQALKESSAQKSIARLRETGDERETPAAEAQKEDLDSILSKRQ